MINTAKRKIFKLHMLQHWRFIFWTFVITLLVGPAHAAIFYVNVSNTAPVAPYSSWPTAVTNIQNAIDAANAGDTVLVTNGVYATGGRPAVSSGNTNRVVLNKALTVQSVNGPWATIIQGAGMTNGPGAIRCAWVTNGATLSGFTMRYGAIGNGGDPYGGSCAGLTNAVIANCLIYSNITSNPYGIVYQGMLQNCTIFSNILISSFYLIYNSKLINCTVMNNVAGVTVEGGALTNCIVYNNSSANYWNIAGSNISHSCTTPLPSGGINNFTNNPLLFTDNLHLLPGSPCIGAGMNVGISADLFGQPWNNPPSIGCCEFTPAPLVSQPTVALTPYPSSFMITGTVISTNPSTCWWIQNGTPLQDNGHFSGTQTTNLIGLGIFYTDADGYQLVASNSYGMTTSAVAHVFNHCVNASNPNPVSPYSTWATAATNIQDAVDVAVNGEIVMVTNGIYAFGGHTHPGITNRVLLSQPITLMSLNGYANTIIKGAWDPNTTNGPLAVRCCYFATNANINGFTLRGGATIEEGLFDDQGGGVCAVSSSVHAIVNNCWITGNQAVDGGGVYAATVINSLISSNNASLDGGGFYSAYLTNCTVAGNFAYVGPGGGFGGTCVNSIIYENSAQYSADQNLEAMTAIQYCCTTPLPATNTSTYHNISDDPEFVDQQYHLAASSPCVGQGYAADSSGLDLQGESWANPNTMGAYEVHASDFVGPLTFGPIQTLSTNVVPGRIWYFDCQLTGRAAQLTWSWDDGTVSTNVSYMTSHIWTNSGFYNVICTAYNNDYPGGVFTNLVVYVPPPPVLQFDAAASTTNGIGFKFSTPLFTATYTLQTANNLTPPVNWTTWQTINGFATNQVIVIPITNGAQFFRVEVQ